MNNTNIKPSDLPKILENYKHNCFICSVCNTIIFPEVIVTDVNINFSINKYSVHGGLGNKTLKDNICPECAKRAFILGQSKVDSILNQLK